MSQAAGARKPRAEEPRPTQKHSRIAARVSGSLLGPARVRLALLVLIAAIPLLMLSATIAVQNYRLAINTSTESADRLREPAIARHVTAISGTEQLLQALALVHDLTSGDAEACHRLLAGILALQSARYSNLLVTDAGGTLRCAATPILPAMAARSLEERALQLEAARRGFVLGPVRASATSGAKIIPAAYPLRRDGQITGYLLAGMRIDWFARDYGPSGPNAPALWIADNTGQVTQVTQDATPGLPQPTLLEQLKSRTSVIDVKSVNGTPCAYGSAVLGDGYTLIVAYPSATDRMAATGLLIRRIGQLGLLLLLGLAAVAIGTHIALVEPLDQLSQAVARWRVEGRFDASILRDPPTEVRELAATFAEATRAIADHAARHQVAVGQQELLMREIHHRVKNNLQIVASLLNLQASRIRLPEARAEFASARDRVRALATLHRHLYLQGEVHTIDMPNFLTELCNQLFQAMGEVPGRRIALTIEASPLQMSSDQAVPLSLVVTEAVSNAVKYAFPGGREGRIRVTLTTDGSTADLVIVDDGVGIPAGKIETETGPRDGIGISLIRGFARQLGATLTVREDAGTCYMLHIPLIRDTPPSDLAA